MNVLRKTCQNYISLSQNIICLVLMKFILCFSLKVVNTMQKAAKPVEPPKKDPPKPPPPKKQPPKPPKEKEEKEDPFFKTEEYEVNMTCEFSWSS